MTRPAALIGVILLGLLHASPVRAVVATVKDDPAVVKMLAELDEGCSLLLPPVKHMYQGKPYEASGRNSPYARDYTTKMVYAPERQTAFYAGGNHGHGRTNDVWEYHLGSNTWHLLFPA